MIDELHVKNVALIRDATIQPALGITVLTGETGAGKTAFINALKLLIGERGDAGVVRDGASALEVEGRFFDSDTTDGEGTVVRRRIDAHGRGRVTIDGSMASVRELAEGVGITVDLCGQHEHQRLLQPQTHVELLDAWIGNRATNALHVYRDALITAQNATHELERVRELARHADERLEEAQFILRRINEVNPSISEYTELEELLPRIEHADALLRASSEARQALSGDNGTLDTLGAAVVALETASSYDDTLIEHTQRLRSILLDIEDMAAELRSYANTLEVDPEALDNMQSRMAALRGLMRTYGPYMEDVLQRRDRAAEVVETARRGDAAEQEAMGAVRSAEQALEEAAQTLTAIRQEAAPQLAAAISAEMKKLNMGGSSIRIDVKELSRQQWGVSGSTHVEIMYQPAAGMTARPLRRIASGGEISRVMLACKVVLGQRDSASTLVFDEVDAGVGGATAIALGDVLTRLAQTHQVIVVTHLAQIAILGEKHYVVHKHTDAATGLPETAIDEVQDNKRVAEIARMLSGDTSDTSLNHAREMLNAQTALFQ